MRYIIIAILALLLGGGLEYERGRVHYGYELGNAYGCGLIEERKRLLPSAEDSDTPERPWCAAYRKSWEKW